MLYNNVGLISEVSEDTDGESTDKITDFDHPVSYDGSCLQRTPTNIRINLILSETIESCHTFLPLIVSLLVLRNCFRNPRKKILDVPTNAKTVK